MEHNREELETARRHLTEEGYLIILASAHQWLFSPFDANIGHFRRYTKSTLCEIASLDLKCILLRYLDNAGLIASLLNRLLLNQQMLTDKQIAFWNGVLVPISKFLDPLRDIHWVKACLVFSSRYLSEDLRAVEPV